MGVFGETHQGHAARASCKGSDHPVGSEGEEHANVLVERRGRTALVWLNRPEKLNALDWDLRLRLEEPWADLAPFSAP